MILKKSNQKRRLIMLHKDSCFRISLLSIVKSKKIPGSKMTSIRISLKLEWFCGTLGHSGAKAFINAFDLILGTAV